MGWNPFKKPKTEVNSANNTTVTVNPEINFDLEELAQAQREQTEAEKIASQSALLQNANLTKKSLELEKNKTIAQLNQSKLQNLYQNRQILFLGLGALLIYGYKKGVFKI